MHRSQASYHGNSLVVFASPCRAELLAPSGEILRSWSDEHSHMWHDAELLADGDLIRETPMSSAARRNAENVRFGSLFVGRQRRKKCFRHTISSGVISRSEMALFSRTSALSRCPLNISNLA